jgi:CRISPR-associated endonuclease/helicase Cas3
LKRNFHLENWFAHSVQSGDGLVADDQSRWELLGVHLRAVANRARSFSEKFGSGEMGYATGLLHDLGKYHPDFQRRLAGEHIRVDHSTAGAAAAITLYGPYLGKLLAYAIAGHHTGLADGVRDGETRRTPLKDRLASKADAAGELALAKQDGLTPPKELSAPALRPSSDYSGFFYTFFGRMMFSALVDADFLETEKFYAEVEGWTPERGDETPIATLKRSLDGWLADKMVDAPDTPVNRLRAEILAHARARAIEKPGVFKLTVPTGGGKTLTSLAFALDHVLAHGLDRVVYVIPYTSIIEQTAEVFRGALGPYADSVLEHHSAFDETEVERREGREKLRLAMENWDARIVVTTAVQFFESLFADRPSRCRKLHNLARSVVVLDEAQTLPLPVLRPCVMALQELVRNYATSVVLCTATQPALERTGDPVRSFEGGFEGARELAPEPGLLFSALKRVRIEHAGTLEDAALAERLGAAEQVLCIVNTRTHARAVFDRIRDLPGTYHLTTLMCAIHRQGVLAQIRADLMSKRPCRVVATSLIEAGVDVDFPVVYRAEAGLDSIAQAAGRCNREGSRDLSASFTYVFEPAADKSKGAADIRQRAEAARTILRLGGDPLAPDAIEGYFREVYWVKGGQALDRGGILKVCERIGRGLDIPFDTIAHAFRMIDDVMVPVIVPLDPERPGHLGGEAANLVARLPFAEGIAGIARKLQRFTVPVPVPARGHLVSEGAAEVVSMLKPQNRLGDQFVVLRNANLYDVRTGLWWEDPAFVRAATLIV